MDRACSTHKGDEGFIVPERERPLGISKCKWKDNIQMHFKTIGLEDMEWNQLAQRSVQWRSRVNFEMRLYRIYVV
jgi:hypothetical protein